MVLTLRSSFEEVTRNSDLKDFPDWAEATGTGTECTAAHTGALSGLLPGPPY